MNFHFPIYQQFFNSSLYDKCMGHDSPTKFHESVKIMIYYEYFIVICSYISYIIVIDSSD